MPSLPPSEFAIAHLRRCGLFARLPADRLTEVAALMSERRYAKHEIIFQQGDEGEVLYLVQEGIVRITAESVDGEEAILGEVHACETFGELGLIDRAARSATASAATDAVTLQLPGAAFRDLLESHREFRDGVLMALSAELRRATKNLGELHFLDLPGRLASRLVMLAREAAPGVDHDVVISNRYSQGDLAAMIGGTRQSVNRGLAELRSEGLIRHDQRSITIVDVPALEAKANW
jgi:CRP/FNR family transcriptional regulator/CRP/FNR family cyclic AMP-dependent transcriptional regulator